MQAALFSHTLIDSFPDVSWVVAASLPGFTSVIGETLLKGIQAACIKV